MILPLLSMILAGACVPTSYGCPDYESQRAAEVQDSLDDVAEYNQTTADSLRYLADSLRATAGATVAAAPMQAIAPVPYAVAHCPEYAARAASLDSLADLMDPPAHPTPLAATCEVPAHPLVMPSAPPLVVLASRNTATEPERATTCYIGLDCPEVR